MLNPKNWINLYADYLLNFAFFRVRNRELAEDLIQDTFISALKSQHTYNGTANEKTWLTAILKNKIIDYYRSSLNKYSKLTDSIDNNTNDDYFDEKKSFFWAESKIPTNWNNTDIQIENNEFTSILMNCVDKMPKKLASIFSLKYLDDEETDIICKDLGISSSNYWVMIHRAKLNLRECLEKNWFNA